MFERLLSVLSHDPGDVARSESHPSHESIPSGEELNHLRRAFPDLDAIVHGQRVLDFGCGCGAQAVALSREGAAEVLGIDINPDHLAVGRSQARAAGLDGRVRFVEEVPHTDMGTVGIVISQNSMEHFSDPSSILRLMYRILRPGGRAAITFSPPWLHPYGAHMHFWTPVPWVHLLFPERTVMKVRARYRDDGASRYEEVEGGLNRMTLRRFEELVDRSDFGIEQLRFVAIKQVPMVTRIPGIREFLTSRVDCLLRKPD